jgi:hypothetical protein
VSYVDDDGEHYAELLRELSSVDTWLSRMATSPEPPAGSALRGDDTRTEPYQLSYAAWNSLTHAVDHLNCLRTLLRDARVVHMFAPFSLARPALENASAAVWLLQPRGRRERITRRLRLAADDIRNGEQARNLIGTEGPRSQEERLKDIRDIADGERIEQSAALSKVGYREIIEVASGGANGPAKDATMLCWRLCSGVAHGDFWTTINATDRELIELPGMSPGVGAFKITAHVGLLRYVTGIAVAMTGLGWRLYDQRSISIF